MKVNKEVNVPTKGNVNVEITEIGPIRTFSANLRNLTILLGKPNSGKSYALRSIYLFLQALDQKAVKRLRYKLSSTKHDWYELVDIPNYSEFAINLKDYIIYLIESIINSLKESNSSRRSISHRLNESDDNEDGEMLKEFNGEFCLKLKLNKRLFTEDFTDIFRTYFRESVNSELVENTKINGKNILVILEDAVSSVLSPTNSDLKVDDESYPLPLTENLNDETAYSFRRILRDIKIKLSLSMNIIEVNESKLTLNVQVNLKPNLGNLFRRYGRFSGIPTSFIDALKQYKENMAIIGTQETHSERTQNRRILGAIINSIIKKLDNTFLDMVLNEFKFALQSLTNLTSVKFIPYGRNTIIQMNNLASLSASFEELYYLGEELENIKGVPYASYFDWLNEGKIKLKSGDEELQKLFIPILGGRITFLPDQETLGYGFKNGKLLDLGLSSAMVEELTGLLLPILSSSEGELLIVEEPEAQLHVSIQILMGLLLIAIAKTKKVRILFSTHSDLIALTIHYILDLKPDKKSLVNLMEDLLPDLKGEHNHLVTLAEAIQSGEEALSSSIFYLNREGISEEIIGDELEKSVPGISNTVETFFKWTLGEIRRSREKKAELTDEANR